MNSLTYLSRQFDVLAQPRAPPSTPTSEPTSFLSEYPQPSRSGARRNSGSDSALKRVKTWSTKSFLLPPSSHYPTTQSQPRRSFSSPADFVAITSMRRSSLSSSLDASISPTEHLESAARRIFFIRVFLLLWNAMRDVWSSLTRREVVGSRHSIMVDDATDTDDKESGDEKLISLRESEPLIKPPNPSYVPQSSIHTPALVPFLIRSDTEPSLPTEAKQGTHSLSATASLIASQVGPSRSSTPSLTARKTPFHLPKTLVLDLDETLIHSTSRPIYSSGPSSSFLGLGTLGRRNKGAGHMVEVVLGGRSTLYHVYKRPFVDFFLRTVSSWYTLVIFTASMQEYADPVIDWLDAGRGILERRFFRDACTQLPNGSYTKDLAIIEQDLSRVCLVDNSPISYRINEANGIPIEGWTHDPSDQALLDLLPVLDSLRFTSDVRRVLGIRGFS